MSSRALRDKFENHSRKPDTLWSDLVYELRGYLNDWLDSVEVTEFDSVKELILTEQVKKRVHFYVWEHYVDSWEEIDIGNILAEKYDRYKAVKKISGNLNPDLLGENHLREIKGMITIALEQVKTTKKIQLKVKI